MIYLVSNIFCLPNLHQVLHKAPGDSEMNRADVIAILVELFKFYKTEKISFKTGKKTRKEKSEKEYKQFYK